MEGGGRSRLSRLLSKLRGDHHKYCLDKGISFTSTAMSESIGCGSTTRQFEDEDPLCTEEEPAGPDDPSSGPEETPSAHASSSAYDGQFAANIDLRYGGQYLTPEQLPAFCQQLHHLVHVIRNIQSYAKVTGEYPIELERLLEREAREVAALAAETRNARDVAARSLVQRRALRQHRAVLEAQLASLKDAEVVELEGKVRLSDRKLFKSWESLRDTVDPAAFDPLLNEIRSKQSALQCLVRLIEGRRAAIAKPVHPVTSLNNENEESSTASGVRKRHDARRNKRRRKEARSVPLSGEPSAHAHPAQVRLYISSAEAAPAPPPPIVLPSGGSVRDILFFTTNTS